MNLNAAALRGAGDVWEGIKNVFLDFEWPFAVEAVLLFFVFYFVFKILAENNAKKLIPVYLFFVIGMGAVTLFSSRMNATAFWLFLMTLSLFFLLLFSMEIKRSVWKTSARTPSASGIAKQDNKVGAVRAEENIASIVKAVQSLSKANVGALIVLTGGNLPKEILDSGVRIGANISSQLIEGIFVPKAPLHDGAMIVSGDKIEAAGCFLPLTQKDFPKDYGTRHRAGIGVTEVADVSTIIVSEETGIVSVVKRGEITRYVDSENLKRFLRDYYWKEINGEGKTK